MIKGTILYIEDNNENRDLVRRVLEAEHFAFFEAANAAQALEKMQAENPDLILMDMNMPEVDGYTLTKHIKGIPGFEKMPILALTANVMQGDREKSLQAGCVGYIQKPIDIDRIVQQVEDHMPKR
ncbi:MAG: response regulator [Anaerolineales bacterium]|nr:response regulator [Anaerolineales bacterium]